MRNGPEVFVALVHYPTYNRRQEVVTTAVTTVDIHDIARCCRTYGVKKFFVVTPISAQKELVRRIVLHWTEGGCGKADHPRKEAMQLVQVCSTLEDAIAAIAKRSGERPAVIVTSAKHKGTEGIIDFPAMRSIMNECSKPFLLVFGTGWGLTKEVLDSADYRLSAIAPESDYNHLSVRAAASIIIDRLLG